MVAIVAGNGLGLFNASVNTVGGAGVTGAGALGQAGGRAYANIATGNLLLQFNDEQLSGVGQELAQLRTYNALGALSDGDADGWRWDGERKVLLIGTLNAVGSSVKRTTGDGHETVYAWNASRSAYVSAEGDGAHDSLSWDGAASEWVWTDGSRRVTERYDGSTGTLASGRLKTVTDSSGNVTSYSYDADGRLASVKDAASGQELVLAYNAAGRIERLDTRSTEGGALTKQVYYAYDSLGRLDHLNVDLTPADSSVQDDQVYTTSYAYDGNSFRIAKITQSDGTEARFTYELIGSDYRLKTVTDASGTTTFAYDTAARRTDVSDGAGQVWSYYYDANAQLTEVRSPAVNSQRLSTSFGYDSDGNVTQVTDGRGNLISYQYDSNGNRILERDATGATLDRIYNAANQLVNEIRHVGGLAQVDRFIYDSSNRLRFTVSAEGRVTEYRYNALGQRTQEIAYGASVYPVSGLAPTVTLSEADLASYVAGQDKTQTTLTETRYDYRGNVSQRTDYAQVDASGNGVLTDAATVTETVYSEYGQLLQTLAVHGSARTSKTTLSSTVYDGLGRVLSQVDGSATRTTVYDGAARKLSVTNAATGLTVTQAYDAQGRLLSVTESAATVTPRETRYVYDQAGRLTQTQDATGVRSYTLYDEAGRIAAKVDGTGAVIEYVYNATGQVTSEIRYATRVDTTTWFDGSSVSKTGVSQIRPAVHADDRRLQFEYDAAGRLTASIDAANIRSTRQYDGRGQLIQSQTGDRITRYFYDKDGKTVGTLDAEGYLTENSYDAAGQLTKTTRYAKAVSPDDYSKWSHEFGAQGWSSQDIAPRQLADVNGDGRADVVGFAGDGVYVALSTEAGFGPATKWYTGFGLYAGGWSSQNTFPRHVADVNGDGKADVVGFAAAGVYVALSTGSGFEPVTKWVSGFTLYEGDWSSNDTLPREVADVNGDGKADVVGFGRDGVYVGLSTGTGFGPETKWVTGFALNAGNWSSQNTFPRHMADINGDGKADVVGFASDGVYVGLSTGSGFGSETKWFTGFGTGAGGWSSNDTFPRQVADVNGDGKADVVGFAAAGVYVALSTGSGLEPVTKWVTGFTLYEGDWSSQNTLPRQVVDVNGDGKADVVGFGNDGVYVTPSIGSVFSPYVDSLSGLSANRASANDLSSHFFYDGQGRLIGSVDTQGFLTETVYDDAQNRRQTVRYLTAVLVAAGDTLTTLKARAGSSQITTTVFDDLGRIGQQIAVDGTVTAYEYDSAGRLVRELAAQGTSEERQTRTRYDAFGQVIGQLSGDAALRITTGQSEAVIAAIYAQFGQRYDYDAAGRKAHATDTDGNTTTFYYDAAGRLSHTVNALGEVVESVYNAFGDVAETTRYTQRLGAEVTDIATDTTHAGNSAARIWYKAGTNNSLQRYVGKFKAGDKVTVTVWFKADADTTGMIFLGDVGGPDPYDNWGQKIEYGDGGWKKLTLTQTLSHDDELWVFLYGDRDGAYRAQGHSVIYDDLQITSVDQGTVLIEGFEQGLSAWTGDGQPNDIVTASSATTYSGTGAARLWYQTNSNSSISRALGNFKAGDTVTATVWYKAPANTQAAIFIGDPSGADPYDNDVYTSEYGTGGWRKLTVTHTLTHDDDLWVYLYGDTNGAQRDPSHSVIYDDIRVVSVQRGVVMHDGFDSGVALTTTWSDTNAWFLQGDRVDALTRSTATTYTGNQAARIWYKDGTNCSLARHLGRFSQGDTVTASVWYKAPAETQAAMFLGDAGGADPYDNYVYQTEYGNDGWRKLTVTRTLSHDDELWVFIYGDRDGANHHDGSSVIYDDLNIVSTLQGRVLREGFETGIDIWSGSGQRNDGITANVPRHLQGGLANTGLKALVQGIRNASTDSRETVTYTPRGLLASRTDAEGVLTTYRYTDAGQLLEETRTLAAGNTVTTRYGYNKRGEQISVLRDVGGLNLSTATAYDAFGRVTQTVDASGKVTTIAYEQQGRVVAVTDPLHHVRRTEVDAFGRTLATTDALGHVTRYAYDEANRRVTVTTPEGISVTTARTRHGDTLSVTDGKGATTRYEYNKNGQLTRTIDALGNASENVYDSAARLVDSKDARGTVTHLDYDAAHRVIRRTVDPTGLNLKTAYEFDALGRQLRVTEGEGSATPRVTAYAYDRKGQVLTVTTDPTGQALATTYAYDGLGNQLRVARGDAANPNQQVTDYRYDPLGRRSHEIADPQGLALTTQYKYDGNGRVTRKIDAVGNSTWYVYNAGGLLQYTVDAEGSVTRNDYDGNDRLIRTIKHINPIAKTMLATWGDTVTTVSVSADNVRDQRTLYVYDRDGRQRYQIDALGHVTEQRYDGAGHVIETLRYSDITLSDVERNLPSTVYQAKNGDISAWEVYDAGGVSPTVTRQYDAAYGADVIAVQGAGLSSGYRLWRNAAKASWANTSQRQLSWDMKYNEVFQIYVSVDTAKGHRYLTYDPGSSAPTLANGYYATMGVGDLNDGQWHHVSRDLAADLRLLEPDNQILSVNAFLIRGSGRIGEVRLSDNDSAAWDTALANLRSQGKADVAQAQRSRTVYDSLGRARFTIDAVGYVTERRYDAVGNVIETLRHTNAINADAVATVDDVALALRSVWSTNLTGTNTNITVDAGYANVLRVDGGRLLVQKGNSSAYAWPSFYESSTRAFKAGLNHRFEVSTGSSLSGVELYAGLQNDQAYSNEVGASYRRHSVVFTGSQIQAERRDVNGWKSVTLGAAKTNTTYVVEVETDAAGTTLYVYEKGQSRSSAWVDRQNATDWGNVRLQGWAHAGPDLAGEPLYVDNLSAADLSTDPDAAAQRTHYVYDATNRQVGEIDAAGYLTEYVYDALGNRTKSVRYASRIWEDGGRGYLQPRKQTFSDYGYTDRRWWADFNGDGRADYLRTIDSVGGGGRLQVSLADEQGNLPPGGFITYENQDWGYGGRRWWADFNGDGKADYLTAVGEVSGPGSSLRINLSNGTELKLGGGTFSNSDWGYADRRWWADFNGDGKADYLTAVGEESGPGSSLYVNLSNGVSLTLSGATFANRDWGYADRRWWADFNGDGKADYIRGVGDYRGSNASLYVALSDGTNLGVDTAYSIANVAEANRLDLADVDGDGRLDILAFKHDGLYVSYFKDGVFGAPIRSLARFGTEAADSLGAYATELIQLDGRGGKDILSKAADGYYVSFAASGALARGIDALRPTAGSDDQSTQYVYDSLGRARYTIDAMNYVTERVYDDLGRVTQEKRYADPITVPALINEAEMVKLMGPKSSTATTTTHVYDAAGRERYTIDALRHVGETRYSATGQVSQTLRYSNPITFPASLTVVDVGNAVNTANGLTRVTNLVSCYQNTCDTNLADFEGITEIPSAIQIKDGRLMFDVSTSSFFGYSYLQQKVIVPVSGALVYKMEVTTGAASTSRNFNVGINGPSASPGVYSLSHLVNFSGSAISATSASGTRQLGSAKENTTYIVEVEVGATGSTLYLYEKGGARAGAVVDTDSSAAWSGARFYAASFSNDKMYVDNLTAYVLISSDTSTIQQTQYAYDANGRLRYAIDDSGMATESRYNAFGNIVQKVRYANAITLPVALAEADVQAAVNANNPNGTGAESTRYVYDALGRVRYTLESISATQSYVSEKVYNSAGLVTEEKRYANPIDTPSIVTEATVRAATEGVTSKPEDSRSTRYVYDLLGRVRYTIDALGYISETTYDGLGQVSATKSYNRQLPISAPCNEAAILAALSAPQKWEDGGCFTLPPVLDLGALGRFDPATSIYQSNGRWVFKATTATVEKSYSATAQKKFHDPGATTQMEVATGSLSNGRNLRITVNDTEYDPSTWSFKNLQNFDIEGGAIYSGRMQNGAYVREQIGTLKDNATYIFEVATDANGTTVYWYEKGSAREAGFSVRQSTSAWHEVQLTASVMTGPNATGAECYVNAIRDCYIEPVRQTLYEYDDLGRVTAMVDAVGKRETYTYDAFGNRVSFTNKKNFTWTYKYDSRGQLIEEVSPFVDVQLSEGDAATSRRLVTRMAYDAFGNVLTRAEGITRDASGAEWAGVSRATAYKYDGLGRQILTIAPGYYNADAKRFEQSVTASNYQVGTEVLYDGLGRAVRNRVGGINKTTGKVEINAVDSYKAYNDQGQVVYDVDATGGVTQYEYDAFGNQKVAKRFANRLQLVTLSTLTSARGYPLKEEIEALLKSDATQDRTITTVYDALNRKSEVRQDKVSSYTYAGGVVESVPTTTFTYNAFNEVIKEEVAGGATTYNYYDAMGHRIGSVDGLGYVSRYEYDVVGSLVRQTEYDTALVANSWTSAVIPAAPAASDKDRTQVMRYDALGRLTSVRQVTEAIMLSRTSYDEVGNVFTQTDAANNVTTNKYDALGRLTKVTEPARTTAMAGALDPFKIDYVAGTKNTVVASPTTTYVLNVFGEVTSEKKVAGDGQQGGARTTLTTYDAAGNVIKAEDAAGGITNYAVDSAGRTLEEAQTVNVTFSAWTDVSGYSHTRKRTYEYDAVGRQVATRDWYKNASGVLEATTQGAEYSAFGEVVNKTLNGVSQQQASYDKVGRLVKTVDGQGTTVLDYNQAGHQTRTTQNGYRVTVSIADAMGRVRTQRLPSFTANTAADTLGDAVLAVVTPEIKQTYDRWGNVLTRQDARGYTTTYGYDYANRVVREVLPTEAVLKEDGTSGVASPLHEYTYDRLGNLISKADKVAESQNVTLRTYTNQYNEVGQLISESELGGMINIFVAMPYVTKHRYALDAFGNRVAVQDAAGNISVNDYDGMDRLTKQSILRQANGSAYNIYTSSATPVKVALKTYRYDQAGQQYAEINGDTELPESLTNSDQGQIGTVRYNVFDERGNVIRTRNESGIETSYAFDKANRKATYTDGLKVVMTWTYDNYGRVETTHTNANAETRYSYDSFGQLQQEFNALSLVLRTYSYRANGLLWTTTDNKQISYFNIFNIPQPSVDRRQSEYVHDVAGQRVGETSTYEFKWSDGTTTVNQLVSNGIRFKYDALGRLSEVKAPAGKAFVGAVGTITDWIGFPTGYSGYQMENTAELQSLKYDYDEQGNRRRISLTAKNQAGTTYNLADWYRYDGLGRMTLAGGMLVNGQIVAGKADGKAKGTIITYNLAGQRATEEQWVGTDASGDKYQVKTLGYNDLGLLSDVTAVYAYRAAGSNTSSGYTSGYANTTYFTGTYGSYTGPVYDIQHNKYDNRGNRTVQVDYDSAGKVKVTQRTSYRGDGMQAAQRIYNASNVITQDTLFNGADVDSSGKKTYYIDGAGNQTKYIYRTYSADGNSVVSTGTYTKGYFKFYESYKEYTIVASLSIAGYTAGTTQFTYNGRAEMLRTWADGGAPFDRRFEVSADGMMKMRSESGKYQNYFYFNGKPIANVGTLNGAQIEQAHEPVSESYPAHSPTSYTVSAGDTLQSIAMAVWGDSRMWYLIADANGLSSDADLRVGANLKIPNVVTSIHNDSTTFKPYNPSDVIGDTTPSPKAPPPPPPPKKKCGGLAMVVMIVVAVVATVLTAGAAAGPMAALFGTSMAAAGSMAAIGTAMAVGAVAGAAGSIASQLVGKAMGVVDHFSWKQVATGAITGAITGGMENGLKGLDIVGKAKGATYARVAEGAIRGGGNYAGSYAANKIMGNDTHFSWSGLASAALSGGITGGLQGQGGFFDKMPGGSGDYVRGLAGDSTSAYLNDKWFGGGRANFGVAAATSVANTFGQRLREKERPKADAFGNRLGNAIVSQLSPSQDNDGFLRRTNGQMTLIQQQLDELNQPIQFSPEAYNQYVDSTAASIESMPELDGIDGEPTPPPYTVGREGAKGFYGVAKKMLGQGANNAAIVRLSKELISANPGVTVLHVGDTLNMPNGSVSEMGEKTYGALNGPYQRNLQQRREAAELARQDATTGGSGGSALLDMLATSNAPGRERLSLILSAGGPSGRSTAPGLTTSWLNGLASTGVNMLMGNQPGPADYRTKSVPVSFLGYEWEGKVSTNVTLNGLTLDQHPQVVRSVRLENLFNDDPLITRTIVPGPDLLSQLKATALNATIVYPFGKLLGDTAGSASVAFNGGYSMDVRSEAAFDLGGNTLEWGVTAGTAGVGRRVVPNSAVEQAGVNKLALPRTPGLGATSTTSELLQRGAIPGREGVVLTQRTVSYNDIWKLSDNSGVEFMLSRENGGFVLRSGSPTSVPVPGGVRPIVHTHPVDADGINSLLPSRADINVLNDYWARNPTLPRPVSQIITGPDKTTIFRATGIDQWGKPK